MSITPTVPNQIPPLVSADLGETIKYILDQLSSNGTPGNPDTSIQINDAGSFAGASALLYALGQLIISGAGSGDFDGFPSPLVLEVPDNNATNLIIRNATDPTKYSLLTVYENGEFEIAAGTFNGGIVINQAGLVDVYGTELVLEGNTNIIGTISTNGTQGVSAGPFTMITSITVTNGIITDIQGS